jgi:Na+/melibiose symporter-like transporter
MAETSTTPVSGPTTPDAFLADRMKFWGRFTDFTLKTTVSLVVFCAWLWWCTDAGFSLLHIIVLPIVVGILVMVL